MKITGKDIAQLYIKEDTQKALDKATVLKEKLSPFAQEFAQQMKQKGEGGVYRSKVTGQNVKLAYAQPKVSKPAAAPQTSKTVSAPLPPVKPAAVTPSPAVKPGLTPGKQTLPTVNVKPSAPVAPTKQTLPNIDIKSAPPVSKPEPEFKGRMIPKGEMGLSSTSKPSTSKMTLPPSMSGMPTAKEAGKEFTQDYARSLTAPRGIRTFDKGNVDTSKFNYPGVASPEGRSTKVPTQSTSAPVETPKPEAPKPQVAPEPPKSDKPEVSSALKDRISPENLGSNPENLVNKDVIKGREPKPMNESVVNVGGNKYRIV